MDDDVMIEIKDLEKSYMIIDEEYFNKNVARQRYARRATKEYQVLKGINLTVKRGEVVGILGKNGSGKSTLQKIMSNIIKPTSGEVHIRGKVSSILELSMGFISDMTGYENIFLRGELYGLKRSEVMEYVDEIIEFANLGDFMYNPVRTYSSGMKARLAFSILIVIDADVFIFDEALGTGDMAFNTQSSEFIRNQIMRNKTVIFTSHSTKAIKDTCTRAIWINDGRIEMDGDPLSVIAAYRNFMIESKDALEKLAEAGVADAEYKLAMQALWANEDDEYDRLIKSAAIHGHAIAQVHYGDRLLVDGDFKDTDQALEMYTLSAEKGNLNGRRKYSMLYSNNLGTVLNLRSIFKQLANDGDPFYMYHYAKLLLGTSWCMEDRVIAFNMFSKAAEKGNLDAKYQTAIMYRDGIGTDTSIDKAVELFSELGAEGHYKSQEILAEMYYNGQFVPRDVNEAFVWYRKSAMQGNQKSQYMIASMYRDGIGVEANEVNAKKWFRRYANSSLLDQIITAAKVLAVDDESSYRNIDTELTSRKLFKMAAETFNSRAIQYISSDTSIIREIEETKAFEKMYRAAERDGMTKLSAANSYYTGTGVKRDPVRAFELYKELEKNGNPSALYRLSEIYKMGEIVEQDLDLYRAYVYMAAERGHRLAIAKIQKWKRRSERRKANKLARKNAAQGDRDTDGDPPK